MLALNLNISVQNILVVYSVIVVYVFKSHRSLVQSSIYYPSVLNCQMQTYYTVSVHDILIFEVFGGVRKMYGQYSAIRCFFIVLTVLYTRHRL